MTDTVESIMALADDYWRSPQTAHPALRAAVERVVKERDALKKLLQRIQTKVQLEREYYLTRLDVKEWDDLLDDIKIAIKE